MQQVWHHNRNAIAFSLAKDLDTGEQLITLGDFFKHGLIVTGLMFIVLWGWGFYGYWQIGLKPLESLAGETERETEAATS